MSTGDRASLVVMLGGVSGSPLEALVREALEASALDSLETALVSGRFDRSFLLTDTTPTLDLPVGVELVIDSGEFNFGSALTDIVAAHDIERLVYVGGGSGPLLTADDFVALARGIEGESAVCVTNNFFSADLFAVTPASLIAALDPPPTADNGVPRRLKEEHGVEIEELPRTTATLVDIDTPIDLAALSLVDVGARLAALLRGASLDTERMARAAMVFTDRDLEVLVAGRVSSGTWQYLERETACRVRVLAEERGMGAAGRDAAGSASSMLGQLIASAGPSTFFSELLPQLCDAAFIDIRPALVELGLTPSRADRFAADVGRADEIVDDGLRELVEAANASPVPVVLGGHSLVTGVLRLVNDWAWEQHDRALGL